MEKTYILKRITENLQDRGYLVVNQVQTNKPGWPNLMAMKLGRVYFIEVTKQEQLPDEMHLKRIQQVKDKGFQVFVTDNPQFFLP